MALEVPGQEHRRQPQHPRRGGLQCGQRPNLRLRQLYEDHERRHRPRPDHRVPNGSTRPIRNCSNTASSSSAGGPSCTAVKSSRASPYGPSSRTSSGMSPNAATRSASSNCRSATPSTPCSTGESNRSRWTQKRRKTGSWRPCRRTSTSRSSPCTSSALTTPTSKARTPLPLAWSSRRPSRQGGLPESSTSRPSRAG